MAKKYNQKQKQLQSKDSMLFTYIPTLIGQNGFPGLIDEALQTDSTLATAWLGLVSVMVSAEIDLKPCGCKAEVYDFIKEALFKKADQRFADYHTNLLNALVYGVAPAEITVKYENKKWWLKDINYINPCFFDLYSLVKYPGEWWVNGLCMVNQKPVKCGKPGSGLPVVWWPVYGEGLLGNSLLRPIINDHKEKKYIQEQRRIAINKAIQGTLLGFQDDGNIEELSQEQIDDVADSLANCAAGADNAFVLPAQIKNVQPVYPAADSIEKSISAENHTDIQILQAFGSQHLARGLLSSFSSADAGEQDQKNQQALRGYFFNWAARQFQNIIDWLVDLNFGEQENYPELRIVSAMPQSPESVVRSAVQLSAAGAIQFTNEDAAYFRRLLRMPENNNNLDNLTIDKNNNNINNNSAVRVPGSFDQQTGMDTRDRAFEYMELKGE